MKNRRIIAAFVGAVAILVAAFLLRQQSDNKVIPSDSSVQAQTFMNAQSKAFQDLNPDEREAKTLEVIKGLASPSLIELRTRMLEAKSEYQRSSRTYDSLNENYSKALLASANPEGDLELQRKSEAAEQQLVKLKEQSTLLNQLTAQFNDELLRTTVAIYGTRNGKNL